MSRDALNNSPDRTHFGAAIGLRNMSDKTRPVHYFQIDHSGKVLVASGIYCPPPPVLKTIRDAIIANPDALTRAMKNPAFKKTFGDLSAEERMSRVPKGYDKNPRCLLVSSDLALNGSG